MTEQETKSQQESTQEQPPENNEKRQLFIFLVILGILAVWGVRNPGPAIRVILVLLGFGGIIMIHEFGHFIVAKLGGIKVEAFSIGMGPVVLGIRKLKKGWRIRLLPKIGEEQVVEEGDNETEYQVALLPIGGFVRMLGQSDTGAADAGDDPRSYANRPVWIRICVVSAGVVFNAVGAMVLFMVLYMNGISLPCGVVTDVVKNSPADEAGIRPGYEIVAVNGESFMVNGHRRVDYETILQTSLLSSGEPIVYTVRHEDNTEEDITVIPEKQAGSKKKLRFSGIEKPYEPVIEPALAKFPEIAKQLKEKTGLCPGDMIKAVNGQPVKSPWHYEKLISEVFTPEVELTLSRLQPDSDERTTVTVKLPMQISAAIPNFRNEYDITHFCSLVPRLKVADDGKESDEQRSGREKLIAWIKTTLLRQEPYVLPLQNEDIIIKVGDVDYPTYKQLRELTIEYEDKEMPVTVLREDAQGNNQKIPLVLNPKRNPITKRVAVGFVPGLDMQHPVVAQVIADSGHATLLDKIPSGATITWVDGQPVTSFYDIATSLQKCAGQKVSIEYTYNNQTGGTAVEVPEIEPVHAESFLVYDIPYAELTSEFKASGPLEAVEMGFKKVKQFIVTNYVTLAQLFRRDGVEVSDLSGPVGIIRMTYQVTAASVDRYLYFLGLISSCLAVMNLLPLPVLDGGHIVLLVIEKITGKPVHEKILAPIMYLGLALLLTLVLFVTYYDLRRIWYGV